MILGGFTGWKPVPPGESRTPPAHRLKTCATIKFMAHSPSLDRDGLFLLHWWLVKRKTLIRHLTEHGAFFLREGRRHSMYQRGNFKTLVPRHTEIVDELARKICKDLDIPWVK